MSYYDDEPGFFTVAAGIVGVLVGVVFQLAFWLGSMAFTVWLGVKVINFFGGDITISREKTEQSDEPRPLRVGKEDTPLFYREYRETLQKIEQGEAVHPVLVERFNAGMRGYYEFFCNDKGPLAAAACEDNIRELWFGMVFECLDRIESRNVVIATTHSIEPVMEEHCNDLKQRFTSGILDNLRR